MFPSRRTTTSFGEFSGLSAHALAMEVRALLPAVPAVGGLFVTRLFACSQAMRSPVTGFTARPFARPTDCRQTAVVPSARSSTIWLGFAFASVKRSLFVIQTG